MSVCELRRILEKKLGWGLRLRVDFSWMKVKSHIVGSQSEEKQ